ncbi:MAG: thiamine phosphate synthase [Victivallaceae bacterium]|nr:thiamine phosphate synthase [Victivallaceae bacterium]
MSSLRDALRLYAVTDRAAIGERDFDTIVEEALSNGATMLQLREKRLSGSDFSRTAEKIRKLCLHYHVPLIVNDDAALAVDCDAVGVHIGQDDGDVRQIRAFLGPDKILGVSACTVEEAIAAEKAGADYLGVGAMFPTATKRDARIVPMEELEKIVAAVAIPVVAIGGITAQNLALLEGKHLAGAAFVSAIFGAGDVGAATRELDGLTRRIFGAGGDV